MLDTLPLLMTTDFPALQRGKLDTLQVNLGYLCNQSCVHCHVNAGPRRTELMNLDNVNTVLAYLDAHSVAVLDVTGGAPEMNPLFRYLITEARARDVAVIDRCNLTILLEEGYEYLAEFLAEQGVIVTASLPCYTQDKVDSQRGKGVYEQSIDALLRLNELGYAQESSDLILNLVYNPDGPFLPPAQEQLQLDYKKELAERHGIQFNELFVITNMPISRFGSTLISKGQFHDYMQTLRNSYLEENLETVMCRNLLSVDWQGYVYDCDFNQMLNIPIISSDRSRTHLSQLLETDLDGQAISVAAHCYGCTAGEGSSCAGALS